MKVKVYKGKLSSIRQMINCYCRRLHTKNCDACPLYVIQKRPIKYPLTANTVFKAIEKYCEQCVDKDCPGCLLWVLLKDDLLRF